MDWCLNALLSLLSCFEGRVGTAGPADRRRCNHGLEVSPKARSCTPVSMPTVVIVLPPCSSTPPPSVSSAASSVPFHVLSLATCLPAFLCLCSIDWVGGRTAFPDWTLGTIGQFYGNGESACH